MTTPIEERLGKLVRVFTAIGRANGTAPPPSDSNTFSVAYEFAVAQRLRELANSRYEQAKVDAITAGVMPDLDTLKVGTHVVYNQDGLSIVIRRNNDSETLDKGLLLGALSKLLKPEQVAKVLADSNKPRKGQTVISTALG